MVGEIFSSAGKGILPALLFIFSLNAFAASSGTELREVCLAEEFRGAYKDDSHLCAPPSDQQMLKMLAKLRKSEVFKRQYADNCTHCKQAGADDLLTRLYRDAINVRHEYFKPEAHTTHEPSSGKFGLTLDEQLTKALKTASKGSGFGGSPRFCKAANECMYVDAVKDFSTKVSWKTENDLACVNRLQNDANLLAIQSFLEPKNEELRKRSFVCMSRLRGDLWRYPVYEKWPKKYPKCEADSKNTGVSIEGACVTKAGTGAPIDARFTKGLEDFVKRLNIATKGTVEELQMGGCFNLRAANESQTRNLADQEDDPILTAANMSNHAEARACDIDAVVLRRGGQKIRLEIKKSGPDSLRDALDEYVKFAPVPALFGPPLRPNERGSAFGLANWRALSSAKKPPQMSQERFERFRIGVAVRNSLIDSGFYAVDPLINQEHRDHFHVSVPRRDVQWQGLRSGKVQEAEFQSACALTRQSKVPVAEVEKHFRRKCP